MKFTFSYLFPAQFSGFNNKWKEAWSFSSFRIQVFIVISVLLVLDIIIPWFFNYIQSIPGHTFNDFILNWLPVQNMSTYIFILIYSAILLAITNLSPYPFLLLKSLQAYCLLILMRIFCLYLVPLNPSSSIIPLEDPFVGQLFYKGSVITKDLFFSGHVSTMYLLFLSIPFRSLKYLFIVATALVAFFILIQHVHYTLDIIAAPPFSWICYKLTNLFHAHYKLKERLPLKESF